MTPNGLLLGAGNLGSLAACYLQRANWPVTVISRQPIQQVIRHIHWPQGTQTALSLPSLTAAEIASPIHFLVLATKAQDTVSALASLLPLLADDLTLIRLQNGLGSLDDVPLPKRCRVIEAVTTSGAWRSLTPDGLSIHVVAENNTFMGDGTPDSPEWFDALTKHWPGLSWRDDIQLQQLLKLSVNAVINPLTALHDCPNGDLAHVSAMRAEAFEIARETDHILAHHLTDWPGETYARVMAVAEATAKNTSSMRADRRAGRVTEVNFINGWLVDTARQRGLDAPLNEALLRCLHT